MWDLGAPEVSIPRRLGRKSSVPPRRRRLSALGAALFRRRPREIQGASESSMAKSYLTRRRRCEEGVGDGSVTGSATGGAIPSA